MHLEAPLPIPYRRRRRRRQRQRRSLLTGGVLLLVGLGMLTAGVTGPFLLLYGRRVVAAAGPRPQSVPHRSSESSHPAVRPARGRAIPSPRTVSPTVPAQRPRQTAASSGPAAAVVWSLPVGRSEVFLTIDDGWFPSRRVLAYMQTHSLPITAFVIGQALREHPRFWQAFVRAGGSVEDHTMTHPDLKTLPYGGVVNQVGGDVSAIRAVTGQAPVLLRPPYGAFNQTVLEATYASGVPDVVMWNAEVPSGITGYGSGLPLKTWNGGPLAPGSIILLHWVPGLYPTLMRLLNTIAADHLQVGNLLHHLPLPATVGSTGTPVGHPSE